MDPAVFGYIRVSQAEGASGLATQNRILTDHGLRDDRIFTDVASGRNMRRPAWKHAPGDAPARGRGRGPSDRPPGPEPHRGSEDHRGAARPGHLHPLPCGGPGYRRRQPHLPAHAPHAAVPGRMGEGDHPESGSRQAWTAPLQRAGLEAGLRRCHRRRWRPSRVSWETAARSAAQPGPSG